MKNSDVLDISLLDEKQRAKLFEFCFNANINVNVGITMNEAYDIINEIEEQSYVQSWDDSGCSDY